MAIQKNWIFFFSLSW